MMTIEEYMKQCIDSIIELIQSSVYSKSQVIRLIKDTVDNIEKDFTEEEIETLKSIKIGKDETDGTWFEINGIKLNIKINDKGEQEVFINDKPLSGGDTLIDYTGDPTNVEYGSVPANTEYVGTVTDLLYKMTHKFIYPTISVSYTGGNPEVYEYGNTVSITKITLLSRGGSVDAFKENKPEMYINDVRYDYLSDTVTSRDNQHIIEFVNPIVINSTTTITFKTKVNNNIITNKNTFTFTDAHYYGTTTDLSTLDENYILNSSIKRVTVRSKLTYKFTVEKGYTFLCYPKSWGNVNIVDQNGFNVTNGYTTTDITINGKDYYLTRVTIMSSVNNFGLTFNFS